MAAIQKQPDNVNFLSPLGFRLVLNRAPHIEYFCQAAQLPTISMGTVQQVNPVLNLRLPDTKIEFAEFSVRFRVDENMENYQEITNWLFGLGSPETTNQYQNLVGSPAGKVFSSGSQVYSDARLIIMTSHKNPNIEINFKDIYPTSLTPLSFETTNPDVQYLEAEASFVYRNFDINVLQ